MPFSRRTVLSTVLTGALSSALAGPLARAADATVRIGILPFGTAAWELDVIRRNGFDKAQNVAIEVIEFESSPATQAALQAGRVDMIVLDWLWVVGRRAEGADWTFAPVSSAAGGLVARPGRTKIIADLPGTKLGIVGPLDKNWLILQAYAKHKFDIDLDQTIEKVVAPPPELLRKLSAGQVEAMVTFWPFAAKAEAQGMQHVISVQEAVRELGVVTSVPFSGFVFSRGWAVNNRSLVDGFLAAGAQARALMEASDDEWLRLKPILNAEDEVEFKQLKNAYRQGIIGQPSNIQRAAMAQLYRILAEIGGFGMVGATTEIPPGTFW